MGSQGIPYSCTSWMFSLRCNVGVIPEGNSVRLDRFVWENGFGGRCGTSILPLHTHSASLHVEDAEVFWLARIAIAQHGTASLPHWGSPRHSGRARKSAWACRWSGCRLVRSEMCRVIGSELWCYEKIGTTRICECGRRRLVGHLDVMHGRL